MSKKLSDALSANYMLADLNVRLWSGQVTDRAVSLEVTTSKGAIDSAAKVIKYLFAGADAELKAVKSAYTSIRTWFYSNSLPWTVTQHGQQKGSRLISATDAMKFLGEFASLKAKAEEKREELKAVWDKRLQEAMSTTGQLYDPNMFPSKAELDRLFEAHMSITPMPDTSTFSNIAIPAKLANGLSDLYERQAEARIENAMGELQERLTSELDRMVTQLSKVANGEKTRLYKSLTGNLQHLVDMARNLNLNNSAALDALADEIETELLRHDVESYKDNASLAASSAQIAGNIKHRLTDKSVFTGKAQPVSHPQGDNEDESADADTDAGTDSAGVSADAGERAGTADDTEAQAPDGGGDDGGSTHSGGGTAARTESDTPEVELGDLDDMLM